MFNPSAKSSTLTLASRPDIEMASSSAKQPAKTIARDGLLAVIEAKKVPMIDMASEIKLEAQVGTGAFGVVWKGQYNNTACAVKALHQNNQRSLRMLHGLLDEFDQMVGLRHPNVLLTMGIAVDQAAGTCGIVMEAMEASLLDVITDGDFLAHVGWSGALLAIAADVAMGMEYIHKNGVLHRDLKPANVLIDATWNAKIADFGTMTRVADDIPEVERLAGTPPYMAPESIAKAAYNTSTDVWGFGCVLSHMASRAAPYASLGLQDYKELLAVIKGAKHSPLDAMLTSDAPAQVKALAERCCAVAPEQRPAFQQIAAELVDWAAHQARRATSRLRPLARVRTRRSWNRPRGRRASTPSSSRAVSPIRSTRRHLRRRAERASSPSSTRSGDGAEDVPIGSMTRRPTPRPTARRPSQDG